MKGPLLGALACAPWLLFALAAPGQKAPHIIFVLTDDLGWNFPGYHNAAQEVLTPTLDKLATQEGVRLESSYMYKFCSPSRGSLMTGRYPWRLPSVRCNLIPSSIPEGVDLGYNMLPKHLAKAGYESYHLGKWHLGFYTAAYTPVARGFNHSWGFLEGGEDHWTHKCGAGKVACPASGTIGTERRSEYFDLWTQDMDNFPGHPLYEMRGKTGDERTYSGYIFTDKAVNFIRAHNQDRPMFMYLSLHNTHAPLQAPRRFVDKYEFRDAKKKVFFAMVSVVDETVRNVTEALKETGMWDNTVLIWATDNGSPVGAGGSNHPFRGGKSSNWEGGVRVPTFITGGVVPESMRGTALHGLVHVSDWYATLSAAAGLGGEADPAGPWSPDSVNQWPYLMGKQNASNRTTLVLDHRMFSNASSAYDCNGQNWFELPGYDALGAIRVGDYKLIVGPETLASWFGDFSPNTTTKPDDTATACWEGPCLFNVVADPGEHINLAQEEPDLVRQFWAVFNKSNAEYHPAKVSPPRDTEGFCRGIASTGGWVAPWADDRQQNIVV